MKDNLENILKDKLDNLEMPYDASAWSSMEKRLDAKGSNGTSKWYWAGGAVVIAVLSSLLVYTWDGEMKEKNKTLADLQALNDSQNSTPITSIKEDDQNLNDATKVQETTNDEDVIIEVVPEKELQDKNSNVPEKVIKTNSKDNQETAVTPQTQSKGPEKESSDNQKNDVEQKQDSNTGLNSIFTTGRIESTHLCYGEELIVKNTTQNKKVKVEVNGKTVELLQNEQARFNNISAATYVNYLDENNEVIANEFVEVYSKPNIRFSAMANLHNLENSLPVIQISNINNDVLNANWSLDGQAVNLNNENEIYCYKAGNHEIKLEVNDANGCSYTETTSVKVDVNYALRASTAGLYPSSNDYTKRTFMPPGLKKLDVEFTLMIIDPRSGAMVFETQDITEEWDGRDIKTGGFVDFNQAYIWQVKLEKSIENCPTTYRGSVTVINGN